MSCTVLIEHLPDRHVRIAADDAEQGGATILHLSLGGPRTFYVLAL
jgi:hypothetical protein